MLKRRLSLFRKSRNSLLLLAVAFSFIAFPLIAQAVKVSYVPKTVQQADGSQLNLFMSGDEFFNYTHTANGSLVREDADGFYTYCVARFDGVLEPGTVRVDAQPLYKGLTIENVDIEANAQAKEEMERVQSYTVPRFSPNGRSLAPQNANSPSLTESDIDGVVMYIRFADEAEFASATSAADQALMNTETYSLSSFIDAQSEGACSFTSVMPKGDSNVVTSFCPTQTRAYFQPYNETTNPIGYKDDNERDVREHVLLQQAIAWLDEKGDVPAAADLDKNQDGAVDSVMFIVNGSAGDWSSLLWPHMWSMNTYQASLNGVAVQNFSFQLANFNASRKLSTYAHETMHVLGFPDLYRYYANGDPIAGWDVMCSDTSIPQYANAYMRKTIANWGPDIGTAKVGTNVVRAPSATGTEPESLRLKISDSQSLVFEYRKNGGTSFDKGLVASGLLPYRVLTTTNANSYGNMYGGAYTPDSYYIYRPGVTAWGTLPWYLSAGYGLGTAMGGGTAASTWALSSESGRTTYAQPNAPANSFFLMAEGSTSAYPNPGAQAEYYVGDVGSASGGTISFKLNTINDFNDYTVSFNTQGGSEIPDQTIFANQFSSEPTNTPTRSGYEFAGWFTSAEATKSFDFATTPILKNTEVFAGWTPAAPVDSGISLDTSTTANVQAGSEVQLSGRVVYREVINAPQVTPLNMGGPLALPASSTPVEGATVYLETSTDNGATWQTDTSVSDVTDATGAYTLSFTPEGSMQARAYVPAQVANGISLAALRTGAVDIVMEKPASPVPASSALTLSIGVVLAFGITFYVVRKRAIV